MLRNISKEDIEEIARISQKKSIRKLSKAVLDDLDREMLSRMICAYLVLKANGHPDGDFARYLITKETRKVMKLGFGTAGVLLPSLLTDGEFRSLVMNTRKQLNKQRKKREAEKKRLQEKLEEEPKNAIKIGGVTIRFSPNALVIEPPSEEKKKKKRPKNDSPSKNSDE